MNLTLPRRTDTARKGSNLLNCQLVLLKSKLVSIWNKLGGEILLVPAGIQIAMARILTCNFSITMEWCFLPALAKIYKKSWCVWTNPTHLQQDHAGSPCCMRWSSWWRHMLVGSHTHTHTRTRTHLVIVRQALFLQTNSFSAEKLDCQQEIAFLWIQCWWWWLSVYSCHDDDDDGDDGDVDVWELSSTLSVFPAY